MFLTGAGRAPPTGTVLVRSATTGASILIDEHEAGKVPMSLPVVLRAGEHSVKVSRPGHADYLDTFRLAAGQDLVLEIDLLPTAGVLRVEADAPGAVVLVDGRPIGEAPFEGEVEPGSRAVEVRAPGRAAFRQTVALEAGEAATLKATLMPLPEVPAAGAGPAWYERWYVWAGAAAVLAGGVAVAVVATRGADGDAKDPEHILRIEPVR
jgi:hypothetical protein